MPSLLSRLNLTLARLVVTALLPWSSAAHADEMARYIDRQLARQNLPGLALLVLKNGKPVETRAFGWSDLERRVPMTADTVFEIGSVSKQFTAVALMLLVEEGKLAVDDLLSTHLPGPLGLPPAGKA